MSKNILSCIHSDIPIWHSYLDFIWHSFGHSINSIWHSFWHSIWHVFWHTFWHLFWHFFWYLFGSRRGPQHPELAIWLRSIGAHTIDELAKEETRRRGGKKKRKELHLCQNLETLTWQVGKNKSDATLQQEVKTAQQPFLRSKHIKTKQFAVTIPSRSDVSVSCSCNTNPCPGRKLFIDFFEAHLALPCRVFSGSDFSTIFSFSGDIHVIPAAGFDPNTLKKSSEKPQNGLQWKAGKLCKSILVIWCVICIILYPIRPYHIRPLSIGIIPASIYHHLQSKHATVQIWLVVSTPLKNISQLVWLFPIYGNIKNVPNHQPEIHVPSFAICYHIGFNLAYQSTILRNEPEKGPPGLD